MDENSSRITKISLDVREIFYLILIFSLLFLGKEGTIVAFSIIGINIFRKREWKAKALLYAFFIRFSNPVLFDINFSYNATASWIILFLSFSASLWIFLREKRKFQTPIKIFFIFCLYILFASLLKSPLLSISLLKLLAFFLGFLTVYMSLEISKEYNWKNFFYTIWVFFIVAGFPFLFISNIGYAINDSCFQGITRHPQFYGIFIAPMILFFFYYYLFKNELFSSNRVVNFTIIIISFIELYFSRSRTAVFAFFLALFSGFIVEYVFNQKLFKPVIRKIFSLQGVLIIFAFMTIFILNFEKIIRSGAAFASKTYYDGSFLSTDYFETRDVYSSREGLADSSLLNFYENPGLGIGFGIPSQYERIVFVEKLPYFNIPISASTEKGVLVTALLEENGIVGFLFFLIWIFFFLSFMIKSRYIEYVLLSFIGLIVNFGEMVFFSYLGGGLYVWFILHLSFVGSQTERELNGV